MSLHLVPFSNSYERRHVDEFIFRLMLCAKAIFLRPLMKTNSHALSKSLSTVSRFHHFRLASTSFIERGNYIHGEIHKFMNRPETKRTCINKRGNDEEMETELFQSTYQTKAYEKLEHIVESTNILSVLRKRNPMTLCIFSPIFHSPPPKSKSPFTTRQCGRFLPLSPHNPQNLNSYTKKKICEMEWSTHE